MAQALSRLPLTAWVRTTIAKMHAAERSDKRDWQAFWAESYAELGGTQASVAAKGCPMAAAFGLWRGGRIADGGVPLQDLSIRRVLDAYGRNAVYAYLALDLLEAGYPSGNRTRLWQEVRQQFRSLVGQEPASSEQGAVRVAAILFEEGQVR